MRKGGIKKVPGGLSTGGGMLVLNCVPIGGRNDAVRQRPGPPRQLSPGHFRIAAPVIVAMGPEPPMCALRTS